MRMVVDMKPKQMEQVYDESVFFQWLHAADPAVEACLEHLIADREVKNNWLLWVDLRNDAQRLAGDHFTPQALAWLQGIFGAEFYLHCWRD